MTLTRALRVLGATTLTGALLFAGSPSASADQVRDAQWPIQTLELDKALAVSKGDGVIVAIIDSGVDVTHPDLAGQILPGLDQSGKDLNTHPTDPHGTGMASEIAAHGHGAGNSSGVIGVAPGAKILPIYDTGESGQDMVPSGIHFAVDHGAKIISISLHRDQENPDLPEAVAYAAKHDVLIVAGTGNDGVAVGSPANEPGILAVGAVDKSLKVWDRSNFGPEVKLTAPGVGVVSAGSCQGSQYCMAQGTSDATAFVSGAAALVRAKFPNLTAGQVANRLTKSALVPDEIKGSSLPDAHYGYGVVRPYEALTQDIPAGAELGPLAKPTALGGSAQGTAGPGAAPEIKASSSSKLPLILGSLAGFVVLVVIVIVILVAVSRSRRRSTTQPGQPPLGASAGWPPVQQPYGNQAPPQGYPPQQPPYPNNPYQNGNQ